MPSYSLLSHAIIQWFNQYKRDLPWRKEGDPYAIWVSEVMLQQTQVKVVIPYFLKWMSIFPTIQSLASSQEEEVLKAWEGLGYYARARYLHKGARYIVENFQGNFPSSLELIENIPGIGPYTAGAILSFAFKKKAAAVDGNVARVLSRYFAIKEKVNMKKLSALVLEMLPEKTPHFVMEGLIELGALVCQKKPKCIACPLSKTCEGFLSHTQEKYPVKPSRKKTQVLHRQVFIFLSKEQRVLLFKEDKALMKGLWHFPYVDMTNSLFRFSAKTVDSCIEELKANFGMNRFLQIFNIHPKFCSSLSTIKHQFTHYISTLSPTVWLVEEEPFLTHYEWVEISQLQTMSFPSGHRKLKDWLVENASIFYPAARCKY